MVTHMKYHDMNEVPLTISVQEFGEIINVSRNTAYDIVRSGKVQSIRVGSQIRITKDALKNYLTKFI